VTGVDDDVRTKVMWSSTIMFKPIRIVQISSLASACIGQSLLTFWRLPVKGGAWLRRFDDVAGVEKSCVTK